MCRSMSSRNIPRGYRGTASSVERGFREVVARVVCAAMAATLIDGKAIAQKVRQEVAEGTRELKARTGRVPGLAVIRVGEDPASKIYVTGKQKAAAEVGFHSCLLYTSDAADERS